MKILNLPIYSIKGILIRITAVSIIAIIYMQILLLILDSHYDSIDNFIIESSILILGFNILIELNIVLNKIYDNYLPIPDKLSQRMAIHFFVGILILVLLFFGLTAMLPYTLNYEREVFYINLGIGLVLMNAASSRLILHNITEKLFQSQNQISVLKQEKLKMDYLLLQDKLNPHFLFNNLTVLKSLTYHKSEEAIPFIENFTDVYRYVLQSYNKQLVSLDEEMEFIKAFISLHKTRLNEGLNVSINVDDAALSYQISPLTLQLLVENSIKHNITSKNKPLLLNIFTENRYIIVKNNVQKKQSTYSTKTGLRNLINRYSFLTDIKIDISDKHEYFIVKVPLL